MERSDLSVEKKSESLSSKKLDVIVSGSIGSIESPRLLRALRRLGATVTPYLTQGGSQFITPMSLSWAADQKTVTLFEDRSSHIASGDACIIAPCSTNFLAKIAQGYTDDPSSALVHSYLGMKKPVLAILNMHDSLLNSPLVQANYADLLKRHIIFLEPRIEEGKRKFSDPETLADEISHHINLQNHSKSVAITMGSTQAYLDDVRYISNYSSGGLGTYLAHEAYRFGIHTTIIQGSCQIAPCSFTKKIDAVSYQEMSDACAQVVTQHPSGWFMVASVSDYVPEKKVVGKIKSQMDSWNVRLIPTQKIISKIPNDTYKFACKLETDFSEDESQKIAANYIENYHLNLLLLNKLSDVSSQKHQGILFQKNKNTNHFTHESVTNKTIIAQKVVQNFLENIS